MKIISRLLLALLLLVAVMGARTFFLLPAGEPVNLKEWAPNEGEVSRMAANLSKAITYKTISWSVEQAPDPLAFSGFHSFLRATYPGVHRVMALETVSEYSLMYRWPGSGGDKKPIAFAAHMDVVPVPSVGLKNWQHPPYAGVIDDAGILWGRGAMDDKGILISLMEAAEALIKSGFVPDRDIYFLFGHDEELGGDRGAVQMAARLEAQGIELAWLIDEGSAMAQGVIPGVQSPVSLISLGEKGSVSLIFSAEDEGGHSSAPKPFTAASLAAKAGYLVTENPHPQVLDEHLESFLFAVAPEMGFASRFAIANLWATRTLLTKQLAGSPTVAAFMHTTTAFTMMKSGIKPNILPQYGEAIVNYRIHPRDTVDGVVERARKIVADDRVKITQLGGREATRMSYVDGEGYRLIAETTRDVFGDIPVAPTLTVQGTDGRHYYGVANDVYRYMPFVFRPDDLKRIHGTNESIGIRALARQVTFYKVLIQKAS